MPGSSPETEIQAPPAEVETKVEAKVEEAAQPTQDAKPAESSDADKKGEKGDLMSAVKAALDKPKAESTPDSDEPDPKSDAAADPSAKKEGEEADDESDDLTEEELTRLRPKTRKRIENLLRDRTDRDAQIADLSPKAQQFDHIMRFVGDAGLTKEDVNVAFDIARNLKSGDPLRAYEQLKPIVAQLAQMAGDVLPDDLQQEVSMGRLTEAHARELALSRTRTATATSQMQRTVERQQVQQQEGERAAHVQRVQAKVTEWERSKEKADPDWKLKQPHVTRLVKLAVYERQMQNPGHILTEAEAVQIATSALTEVEKEFKAFAPRRREIKPITDAGSARGTAAPKSMLEAARAGLARAAG